MHYILQNELLYFDFPTIIHVFQSRKVVLINIQNENNLHSISRYMLFWCPPILLAASQSYLPESDNFTSLICSDELLCCPLTSIRPSGLCLHWFRKNKDFMRILCKMMMKHIAFIIDTINENKLLPVFIFYFKKAVFIYTLLFLANPFYQPTCLQGHWLISSKNLNISFINLFYLLCFLLFIKLVCSSRKDFVVFQLCSLQT